MNIQAIKTRIYNEHEDLISFLIEYLPGTLSEKSIVVVTSKIVALTEGRTARIADEVEREALIRQESSWALETKHTWLTITDGMVMASAGIDESNADGKIILLPKNSFRSAEEIRKKLMEHYHVQNLGVLITDSRTIPLRAGIVGVALGYAGFKGIRDYRGTPDIFGRILKMSRTNVADSVATAAVLEMGEGNEQQPLAIVIGARIDFIDQIDIQELFIDPMDDMYRPFFENISDEDIHSTKDDFSTNN